ncbi:MAG: GTP-sensing pleiotropic transcriptional regulator CodY [Firmicutes bacterium]|nr:GTP-sensing pleiotropic transcriptional regulator CodY [Bacillota bacterium]
MQENILSRVRKLNWVLSESTSGYVSFDELCDIMYDLVDANVYIMNRRGKVLASRFDKGQEAPLVMDKESGKYMLPDKYHDKYLEITETKENLTGEDVKALYGNDYDMASKYHTFVPVVFGGQRIATMLFVRDNESFSDEDIAICEYGATVVGIEVSRGIAMEEEADSRHKSAVQNALETLSYSEMDAVSKIIGELDGNEGLLVASKIADKSGITRSVIVNALRKLESAGVIESRSLGMKGTRIKITNEYLRDEIKNLDI